MKVYKDSSSIWCATGAMVTRGETGGDAAFDVPGDSQKPTARADLPDSWWRRVS